MPRHRLFPLVSLCLVLVAPPSRAEPLQLPSSLDLDGALRLFRQHGLDRLIADAALQRSRAEVTAAAAVPAPLLFGSFSKAFDYNPNEPATCPPGSGCSSLGLTVALSDQALWDIVSGKRGLRIKTACAALAAAQLSRRDLERTLLFQVKRQLVQAALAQRLVELSSEVVATAARTAELGRQRFTAGATSEVELAKAETDELLAQQAEDAARNELRLQQLELAFLLGAREPVPPFQIQLELSPPSPESIPPLDEAARAQAIELALTHRPDLQAQGAERARAQAGLRAAYRQLVPDVILNVQYQQQGRGQTAIQPPNLTVGATLALPWFGQARAAIERGRADLLEQSLQVDKRRAQVVRDVESSYAQLSLARRLIERLESGLLRRAERARDLAQLRYEKGAASLLEYLDAQRVFVATRREYVTALASHVTARFALEQALGLEM